MKQRVGENSSFNFDFVKTFLEAYYDSFDIIFEKIILGTYKPKYWKLWVLEMGKSGEASDFVVWYKELNALLYCDKINYSPTDF